VEEELQRRVERLHAGLGARRPRYAGRGLGARRRIAHPTGGPRVGGRRNLNPGQVVGYAVRDAQPRLAPRGTPEWEAVRRVLNELMDERVPLMRDDDPMVELPHYVLGRVAPGTDLLVVYAPGVGEVFVITLRKR
jgi:hypothetical protein